MSTAELDNPSDDVQTVPATVTNIRTKNTMVSDDHMVMEDLPVEFTGQRVRVTINGTNGVEGNQPIHLGVNGYVIELKRGKEQAIPIEHYVHLTNMKEDVVDERGNKTGERHRHSFVSDSRIIPAPAEHAKAHAAYKEKIVRDAKRAAAAAAKAA